MANTIQDEIYRSFLEISRQQGAGLTQASQLLADVVQQAESVRQDLTQQTARTAGASSGSSANRAAGTSGGSQSTGDGSVLSTVFDAFKTGLGVSPLIKGILGLFGGGDEPAPAPLVKYALPPAMQFQAAEVGGRVMSADYDQTGMARGYGAPEAAGQMNSGDDQPETAPGYEMPEVSGRPGVDYGQPGTTRSYATEASGRASGAAPQITVNVNAMDARSFMDRSSDIALAVRDAMLNLNAINDVVNDL